MEWGECSYYIFTILHFKFYVMTITSSLGSCNLLLACLLSTLSQGIVALFLGRLVTALLAVMDMNGAFPWRERNEGVVMKQ